MAKKLTLDDAVFLTMRNGHYWTYWDLQRVIKNNTGTFYGENSIAAATRNMRKDYCRIKYNLPMHKEVLVSRRIAGGKGYEYKLITE